MNDTMRLALELADAWLCEHLHHAEPLRGDVPEEYLFRCKVFNELASYVHWRERLGHAETSSLETIRRHILSRVDDGYLQLAARDPRRVLAFCSAIGYALGAGELTGAQHSLARWIISPGFAWSTEWLPCRQLDLLQASRIAGIAGPVDARTVIASSSVAFPPSPFLTDREGYYSFTHSAYYGWLLQGSSTHDDEPMALAIEGGLCRALHDGDMDLACELLAIASLYGTSPGPAQRQLLHRMLPSLLSERSVHAPANTTDEAVAAFVGVRPEEGEWAERIHATLVAALGIACALSRGWRYTTSDVERDRSIVDGFGGMVSAFQRRRWKAGLARAEEVLRRSRDQGLDVTWHNGLVAFLASAFGEDGVPHGLIEERMAFRRLMPEGDFERSVLAPLSAQHRVVVDLLSHSVTEAVS